MNALLKIALFLTVFVFVFEHTSGLVKRSDIAVQEVGRKKRQTTGLFDCGGTYTAPTGFFHTPGFPLGYLRNQTCQWSITVPPPYTTIRLEFVPIISLHDVEINGTVYCADILRIYDGPTIFSPRQNWCGHALVPHYTSSGNSLFLSFESDNYNTNHHGFLAVYAGLTDAGTNSCVDLDKMEKDAK